MADFRPIPDDPGASAIQDFFDANEGEPWLLSQRGDYGTFACEAWQSDGSGFQRVVAFEIPVRENHTTEVRQLRVMLHPEMAAALANDFANALKYL